MIEEVMGYLERLGSVGLFIHSMLDAIIFPVPAFFLQVSLSVLSPENAIWLATIGYVGCLLGTPIGFAIGRTSGQFVLGRFMKKKWLDAAASMFRRHGETAILIGSFTPIPFKLFTILSGCMNYSLWKLMCYAAVGRALKFYVVGILFYFYGRAAETMVDQVLGIVVLAVGILIVAGWFLLKKLRQRKRHEQETRLAEDQSTEQGLTSQGTGSHDVK